MNFCRHMKEGFNTKHASGVLLRKKRLERCGKDGQLLTHIKPSHVRNTSRTDLRSPEDLFAAAHGAGFEVVVAVYRHNALARAVSSFEIHRYAWLKREDPGRTWRRGGTLLCLRVKTSTRGRRPPATPSTCPFDAGARPSSSSGRPRTSATRPARSSATSRRSATSTTAACGRRARTG